MGETYGELDRYLFHQGTLGYAYKYLGAHRAGDGYYFRVWAPNADAVWVSGDFNDWELTAPMQRITAAGIWEAKLPSDSVKEGDCYKFCIASGERRIWKADPYARYSEGAPGTNSRIREETPYAWKDAAWIRRRRQTAERYYQAPMHIYEMHLGSWHRREDGTYLSYREIADMLAPYLVDMGYTHVELMPVMEHPFDGSWGYQVCGYYNPMPRYGTPDDFRYFVDTMHASGIGVFLDWVPAHFPKDAYGLYEFDGKPLYEYQGKDRMENRGWGTRCFDVGREEVQSFLISNATYWAKEFHADGLRVDAVSSMLYLDYDRDSGEWLPNVHGDNRNLEAIAFLKKLNMHMRRECPGVLMIAEEATAYPHVTGTGRDGLGFHLKWNMGWMNDTLFYVKQDPVYRKYHHDKLTFSLMFAFNEQFVLPISHDEVVHGKKSMIDKMPGDYWKKFAGARVFAAYQMLHPGKKLTFMGSEIGQFREWAYEGEIEWFLLDEYATHRKHKAFVKALNAFYLAEPALWQVDDSFEGFKWIDADDRDHSFISFRRIDKNGKELIVVLNFTPVTHEDFWLQVPIDGTYVEVFNTDDTAYGGSGVTNTGVQFASESIGGKQFVRLRVPPLGGCVLRCVKKRAKARPVRS